ncbi:MAG: hypothetical protein LBV13_02980 [Methanomassiliicoccaceae archaeon]|jgi:hypothetical protein|nr:hypothetical protein [Methanomassiliicoccaceae archaeon]
MGFFKIDKTKWARYSMMPGAAKSEPQYGDTQLGKAMAKAIATIEAREKAGKIKPANATAFRGRIDGLKPLIGKDEDAGLLQVAQIIGAINRSL